MIDAWSLFATLHRRTSMPQLVGYLLLFILVGAGFILIHLLMGKLIRPAKPHDEKLTIYECGEPTIGSAWVQFDVRFYVVALLFVIFDVEVAFFFPWAVVFGGLTHLAQPNLTEEQRVVGTWAMLPTEQAKLAKFQADRGQAALRKNEAEIQKNEADVKKYEAEIQMNEAAIKKLETEVYQDAQKTREPAHRMAWISMLDIGVFFGVLLVGFAYLWRRGDVQWVRSTAAERPETAATTS
jgi:NADH-quinone oxidoreductase subunit A